MKSIFFEHLHASSIEILLINKKCLCDIIIMKERKARFVEFGTA